jgi:hypothetical protein
MGITLLQRRRAKLGFHVRVCVKRETSFKINGGGIGASDLLTEFDESHLVTHDYYKKLCTLFTSICRELRRIQ